MLSVREDSWTLLYPPSPPPTSTPPDFRKQRDSGQRVWPGLSGARSLVPEHVFCTHGVGQSWQGLSLPRNPQHEGNSRRRKMSVRSELMEAG